MLTRVKKKKKRVWVIGEERITNINDIMLYNADFGRTIQLYVTRPMFSPTLETTQPRSKIFPSE